MHRWLATGIRACEPNLVSIEQPAIPLGNHEPAQLARFLAEDFTVAWNAMARCSPEPAVGGNLMFARQALSYLELAARTASSHSDETYTERLSTRLVECSSGYFTELPGAVPVPSEFALPAAATSAPDRQLIAALFDTARHGLAHLSQQIPVHLSDHKIWMFSFTGVAPGELFVEELPVPRREGHLDFRVSPKGHVYVLARPEVLLADLIWSARLAAIFSKTLAPAYPERPRQARRRARRPPQPSNYAFSSSELIEALLAGGHRRLVWTGANG